MFCFTCVCLCVNICLHWSAKWVISCFITYRSYTITVHLVDRSASMSSPTWTSPLTLNTTNYLVILFSLLMLYNYLYTTYTCFIVNGMRQCPSKIHSANNWFSDTQLRFADWISIYQTHEFNVFHFLRPIQSEIGRDHLYIHLQYMCVHWFLLLSYDIRWLGRRPVTICLFIYIYIKWYRLLLIIMLIAFFCQAFEGPQPEQQTAME